jgi:hypothetical protein
MAKVFRTGGAKENLVLVAGFEARELIMAAGW